MIDVLETFRYNANIHTRRGGLMAKVLPKFKGFICTTAHPDGCKQKVMEQVEYLAQQKAFTGPKNVLIIGASTGFGFASRMALALNGEASTLGVFLERPYSETKNASAGWYHTAAFEEVAHQKGLYAKSINGDAFSNEIKQKTIECVKQDLGKVDLVVYSLASPRRTHPDTGETFFSTLKPIGSSYTGKTVDMHTAEVSEVTLEPATDEEIRGTVGVMGGEDWERWMDALQKAGVLSLNATTVAYSYIGPEITHPIYREGTIGRAKKDLEDTATRLNQKLEGLNGRAFISVNKALVTQASSAIPVVPLYISLLYKKMKEKGTHEDCIRQMYRLFYNLYSNQLNHDEEGRIRMDDLEMEPDVQEDVQQLWKQVDSTNILALSDIEGYRKEFFQLFGFFVEGVDYEQEVDLQKDLKGLVKTH